MVITLATLEETINDAKEKEKTINAPATQSAITQYMENNPSNGETDIHISEIKAKEIIEIEPEIQIESDDSFDKFAQKQAQAEEKSRSYRTNDRHKYSRNKQTHVFIKRMLEMRRIKQSVAHTYLDETGLEVRLNYKNEDPGIIEHKLKKHLLAAMREAGTAKYFDSLQIAFKYSIFKITYNESFSGRKSTMFNFFTAYTYIIN